MQSNSNSGRKILIMLMCMASLMLSHSLLSQGVSMRVASAVDTKGVRHYANGQGRKGTPWMDDATYAPRPQYPYEATRRQIMGSGFFRLTLDPSRGSVVNVTMVKSTGSPILDNAATSAFRQWRWKPGRWKEIDLPITFTIGGRPPTPPLHPPGAMPFPPQR